MPSYNKILLSGSTSGRGVSITQTATAGDTVHTAIATADGIDEVWMWASNIHTADVLITVEFGGVTPAGDNTPYTVPFNDGGHLIIPGWTITGGLLVKVFADTTAVINTWNEKAR